MNAAEIMLDTNIRLREVRAIVGVGASTIDRWVKAGTFPRPYRFGGQIQRWRKSEIDAWMKAHAPPESGAAPWAAPAGDAAAAPTGLTDRRSRDAVGMRPEAVHEGEITRWAEIDHLLAIAAERLRTRNTTRLDVVAVARMIDAARSIGRESRPAGESRRHSTPPIPGPTRRGERDKDRGYIPPHPRPASSPRGTVTPSPRVSRKSGGQVGTQGGKLG